MARVSATHKHGEEYGQSGWTYSHIYATYALDTCFKMFMKGVSMPVGDGEGGGEGTC